MLEFIKMINNDYSGVLSLVSSLIMVVVTIIYVGHTKRQANYAKESVELVTKQIKTDKQPCIVPEVTGASGVAFDAESYTRVQLGFDINLKNVGDAPAINVYTLADIELQFTIDAAGNKKLLHASLLPEFVQALAAGEDKMIHIHFETAEVHALIRELAKSHELNMERIRNNPHQHAYVGAKLIIRVLFKNVMGQWCESSISQVIAELNHISSTNPKTRKQNGSFDPKLIRDGDKFDVVLFRNCISPFTYKTKSDEYVDGILNNYTEKSPWLIEALENEHE